MSAQGLRVQGQFFVSRDIFLNPKVSRRARSIYVALCFLTTVGKSNFTYKNLAAASGYNPQLVSKALKELQELGFIKRDRSLVDIVL